MKSIIISLLFFSFNSFLFSNTTKIFKIGYIDLKNDVRYTTWGIHPVDIRSKYSIQKRAIEGAKLAIKDSIKFERLSKTVFVLEHLQVTDSKKLYSLLKSEKLKNYNAIILDLELSKFKKIKPLINERTGMIFFNVSDSSNSFRTEACIKNLYHTYPSDTMKTDSIAQFLVKKKWNKTLLLSGSHYFDKQLSDSFRVSAKKFGIKIVEEKFFLNSNDPRARNMNDLSFITKKRNFNSIFISDIDGEFALGVPYATLDPVAVIGASGLTPKAWHWSYLRHGAPQLNGRFERLTGRRMTGRDWAAWVAIKSLVESVLRTNSIEKKIIEQYLTSEDFTVDGSKGISLSYRKINKQLRQTILLVSGNNWTTEVAPLEGFENRNNTLDSIGINVQNIACNQEEL